MFFEVSICGGTISNSPAENSGRCRLWYSHYLVWPQGAAAENGSVKSSVAHLAACEGPSGTPVFENGAWNLYFVMWMVSSVS